MTRSTYIALRVLAGIFGLVLLFIVAGCSSSEPMTIEEVSDGLECTTLVVDSPEETSLFAAEEGQCDDETYIHMFNSPGAKDSWLEIATSLGGPYLVGENWTVEGNPEVLEEAKGSLGGKMVGGF